MPTQYGLYAACALAAANAGALVAVTEQIVKLQRKQGCIDEQITRHQAQIARQELDVNQYLKRITALETLETEKKQLVDDIASRCVARSHAAEESIATVRADNDKAMSHLKEQINRGLPPTIRNVMRADNANALRHMSTQLSARNRSMEESIAAVRADMLRRVGESDHAASFAGDLAIQRVKLAEENFVSMQRAAHAETERACNEIVDHRIKELKADITDDILARLAHRAGDLSDNDSPQRATESIKTEAAVASQ
jgi:hypothetical protein